jgi:hypothetical protein
MTPTLGIPLFLPAMAAAEFVGPSPKPRSIMGMMIQKWRHARVE